MAVRPTETFCSEAVKDLDFENRQCVFPYEKELRFFPSYLGANCELNCRVTQMIKFCNCYTYFFYNNKTNDRICSYKDIPCLVDNFGKNIIILINTLITYLNDLISKISIVFSRYYRARKENSMYVL